MAPMSQFPIGTPEPRVLLEIEGKPVNFLPVDTGASLYILLSNPLFQIAVLPSVG